MIHSVTTTLDPEKRQITGFPANFNPLECNKCLAHYPKGSHPFCYGKLENRAIISAAAGQEEIKIVEENGLCFRKSKEKS